MAQSLSKLRKRGAPEMPMRNLKPSKPLFREEEPQGDTSSDAAPISLNPENDDSDPQARENKRREQRRKQQDWR